MRRAGGGSPRALAMDRGAVSRAAGARWRRRCGGVGAAAGVVVRRDQRADEAIPARRVAACTSISDPEYRYLTVFLYQMPTISY